MRILDFLILLKFDYKTTVSVITRLFYHRSGWKLGESHWLFDAHLPVCIFTLGFLLNDEIHSRILIISMIQEAIGAIGPSAQWPNDPKSGPLAQIDTLSRIVMYRGGLGGRTPPLGGGVLDPGPWRIYTLCDKQPLRIYAFTHGCHGHNYFRLYALCKPYQHMYMGPEP